MNIPLTKPYWGKEEERAVVAALRRSNGVGDGPWSKQLARKLSSITGASFVYPVTSCTHGLELAMAALGVGPDDEVILPSFTMTSTANAVILRGAQPVFADIDAATYAIDPVSITERLTKKTRGVIVVHYGGMPAPMEEIISLAKKYKLFVVEDAAHAIGSRYKGKALGTWGDIGVFSFHGTKNISCGEGGAVVTNDRRLAEAMQVYRANGTNRHAFLAGRIKTYSWVGPGSSYFLSDILASIVETQLKKLPLMTTKRGQIAAYYTKHFGRFTGRITLPTIPKGTISNWHIYAIRFQTHRARELFIKRMRAKGIEVSSHFVPLHTSVMGKRLCPSPAISLPVTDRVAKTLVRLPIYPSLTKQQMQYIVRSAQRILEEL